MSQHDSNFYKPFIWVMGALVVFTFIIALLANMFSPATDRSSDPLVIDGLKKQIAPVGKSRVASSGESTATAAAVTEVVAEVQEAEVVAEPEAPAAEATVETTEAEVVVKESEDAVANNSAAAAAVTASTAAVAATAAVSATADKAESGADAIASATNAEIPLKVRAVVATNCAGCHQEGVKGAQRSDDAAAWTALAGKGLDTLTASVIDGKGAMMPRAETSLSDDEIGLAVQHMISNALGNGATVAPAAAPSEVEKSDADSATDDAAAIDVTETTSTTETASAATTTTDTSTAATAAVAAPAEVPTAAEVPANVKAVVDSLCAGCHISGVANAPKYGDKAAWDQRLAMGMDKLLASAIAGKGAMPARGGSQLSDAELQIAIEYMANK